MQCDLDKCKHVDDLEREIKQLLKEKIRMVKIIERLTLKLQQKEGAE